MKVLPVLFFVTLFGFISADQYTTKYDNVDVEQILKSDRLLKNYVNCLLDKGKCTSDANELKRNLPDALQNGCGKCSEKQKSISKKITNHLLENKKDWWNALEKKYDPQGIYRQKYEAEAKSQGIKL